MTYYHDPNITDFQKQIIMGTILGGSSIVKPKNGKNCCLFMRDKNLNWLQYKSAELQGLTSQKPLNEDQNTYRWHSNCYPVFNEFYSMFYKNDQKIVSMEILDKLRDIALAIWYGDAGKLVKDQAVLNTHRFGEKGTEIITDYLNIISYDCKSIKERNNSRICFTPDSTIRFFKLIGEKLPEFMWGKLEIP